jgi:hypothetical protein
MILAVRCLVAPMARSTPFSVSPTTTCCRDAEKWEQWSGTCFHKNME